MVNQESPASQFANFRFSQSYPVIRVPQYGCDRSDGHQLGQDPWQADISGVQDVVYTLKDIPDFGIEIIVGVRKDADSHGLARPSGRQ